MKMIGSKVIVALTVFQFSCLASATATAATIQGAVRSWNAPGWFAIGAEVTVTEIFYRGGTPIPKKNGRIFFQTANQELTFGSARVLSGFRFRNIPDGAYLIEFRFRNPYTKRVERTSVHGYFHGTSTNINSYFTVP